uniref:Theileria-specific sub-telomeric protein, putative n=1 Tax=Theileria annulata TaxID=5874 RepID=A0A3B0MGA0_THEAN
MGDSNPTSNYQQSGGFNDGDLQIAAYMFAGLAMMLNIRLSYSAAPFALLRFKLPENLFSVFVRTTSSALELWCLPSMLLGNIMEQVYNYTQNIPGVHEMGIKNSELKSKAGKLKGTATDQSNIELGSTEKTDLNKDNNFPQDKLKDKAGELATKAQELNKVAADLETAAGPDSPLNSLKGDATQLKDAAMGSGIDGLFGAAQELAKKKTREDASGEADAVIIAFDKVEENYNNLMDAYKKILDNKEKAAKLTQTDKDKVIDVVKKYLEVKNTYYQMIITYRIQKKAQEFYQAVNTLKTQAAKATQTTKPKLKDLNTNAQGEMTTLEQTANLLKTEAERLNTASDSNIVRNYLEVEKAYYALSAKEQFKAAKDEVEVISVKTKFEALQKSYENVLRLRVQELSDKAQTLSTVAGQLTDPDLTTLATQLKEAASQDSDDGLKQKAESLVTAINSESGDSGASKATNVIKAFEGVTEAYNDLAAKPKYKTNLTAAVEKIKQGQQPLVGNETNVKAVEDAYANLKTLYNSILIFTKIKHYSTELESAATDTVNAKDVIKNFNSLVAVYKLLGDPDHKSIVQTQFDELQEEYSEAIYSYKWHLLTMPSMITNWLNFLTFVILFIVYISGGDQGSVTGYYWVMAISGFVFGINMVLVYAVDYRYLPYYIAGENSFPIVTSAILYFATSIFGNRRKYNSDYLVVLIDISISIFIALVASVLWTVAFREYRTPMAAPDKPNPEVISPVLLVLVGMGLVYSIYPGIAPGMIVPFYLIDKIEMVLLILTTFPPLIFAFTTKFKTSWSPKTEFLVYPESGFKFGGWNEYNANDFSKGPPQKGERVYAWIWHFFDILAPLQIILAVIFIYSIHYRDSSISRSIVNQPKMSTFLTIIFYMCHEIMLATGFPGLVCNGGVTYVLLPTQWVGALLMVLLAFYSIGYITEYKRHDPSQWPTDGMTKWNAMCYWLKMASKITNKNFKQLFTKDLRRDLVLTIQNFKF